MDEKMQFEELVDGLRQYENNLKNEATERASLEEKISNQLTAQLDGMQQKFLMVFTDIKNQISSIHSKSVMGESSLLVSAPGSYKLRLDFPVFDGSNPRSWFFKCNNYFQQLPTISDAQKVHMAISHFEGKALLWYQNLQLDGLNLSWNQFIELVYSRFDISRFELNPRNSIVGEREFTISQPPPQFSDESEANDGISVESDPHEDAGLEKRKLDEIVLVGGSTRIPKIQQPLRDYLDSKEPNKGVNPDEAVAFGAAVQRGILSGEGGDETRDILLLDVAPLTLSIETIGGLLLENFSKCGINYSDAPMRKDGIGVRYLIDGRYVGTLQQGVMISTEVYDFGKEVGECGVAIVCFVQLVGVMPYGTGCKTPLSNFEANSNYKDVSDPEVMVVFPVIDNPHSAPFVAWTITPWTLPNNLALCVTASFLVDPYHDPPTNMTYKQLEQEILNFCEGLRVIGLNPEEKLALFANNSCRWLVSDQGIMATGAINVVRGTRSSVEELLQIYNHSESVALVVDDPDMYNRISETFRSRTTVRFVILLWGEKTSIISEAALEYPIYSYKEILDLGCESREALRHSGDARKIFTYETINSDDTATLVCTSGTTGNPKGVMLTHKNLLNQIKNLWDIVPAVPGDRFLSMLPPWHAYERACEYFIFTHGIEHVYTTVKNLRDENLQKQEGAELNLFNNLNKVVNFGNVNTREAVCDVVEVDITQLVVQFPNKLGNVCGGNTQFPVIKRELPREFDLRKTNTTDWLTCILFTFSSLDPRGRGSHQRRGNVMSSGWLKNGSKEEFGSGLWNNGLCGIGPS